MEKLIRRKMPHFEAYNEAKDFLPEICLEVLRVQDREYYVEALDQYEAMFGKAGIIDLYSFYLYCKALKIENHILVLSFAHDLNSRNDGFTVARTDGYQHTIFELTFNQEEIT